MENARDFITQALDGFNTYDTTPKARERRKRPITIWLDPEIVEDYSMLQQKSKNTSKPFSDVIKKVVAQTITKAREL